MFAVAVTLVLLALLPLGAAGSCAGRPLAPSRVFTLEITEYDPRDLLHGRELRFRLQLAPIRADRCGDRDPCCACLRQSDDVGLASIERTSCTDTRDCDGWLAPEIATRTFRFDVPESKLAAFREKLLSAVVRRASHARIAVDAQGRAEVRALLVDGTLFSAAE